jgi:hypothetical protein
LLLFANFLGIEMPNRKIGALRALKRAEKEAARAQRKVAAINSVASRYQTSPLDVSEPHTNTDLLDIPCTPVAPTTVAADELFETPAATVTEAGAVEMTPSDDDEAEEGQDRPKRARKPINIMNVSDFPTNYKWKTKEVAVASTDTLGNAIYDEKLLVEGIQQLREGCPGCGKHTPIAFQESVTRGLGGHLKFTCSNKKCIHETMRVFAKGILSRSEGVTSEAPCERCHTW